MACLRCVPCLDRCHCRSLAVCACSLQPEVSSTELGSRYLDRCRPVTRTSSATAGKHNSVGYSPVIARIRHIHELGKNKLVFLHTVGVRSKKTISRSRKPETTAVSMIHGTGHLVLTLFLLQTLILLYFQVVFLQHMGAVRKRFCKFWSFRGAFLGTYSNMIMCFVSLR